MATLWDKARRWLKPRPTMVQAPASEKPVIDPYLSLRASGQLQGDSISGNEETQSGLEAVDVVRNLLRHLDEPVKEQAFDRGLAFHITFDGPTEQGIVQVDTRSENFTFELIFTGFVKPEARALVAEYFMRVNWELMDGYFVVNLDNGAAKYRATINFLANGLTGPLVRNAILEGMLIVETYAQGVIDVARGNLQPQAAAIAARSPQRAGLGNS